MYQLIREYSDQREAMLEIRSRCASHRRMIVIVKKNLGLERICLIAKKCNDQPLESLDYALHT
ncbi:uncharacterized protein N7483_003602 [Penicillium malachiteum]|uniref:uncharacterized protein n=1 Tax=Penicillium malachiteum TaxID=1324776 RepID=UPI0025488F7D|nr:uncharacterized protein N7483_003602 [Penicillium malachiteum]KAJ5729094.1 hypothetical protein N7483_003602 [Penicillium malachiteum]